MKSSQWNRRDVIKSGLAALAAAGTRPLWALSPSPAGTVVLFQGDSITDCGRDRASADPNRAGPLGTGYPLLIAAAELAARPERGLKVFNRGISGNRSEEHTSELPSLRHLGCR